MEKIKIILVDDDRLAVSYMKSIVDWESLGYEIVAVAYNGKQALNMVEMYSPQLVITDIIMPHMGGIELCRKIKKISKDIRVVLLTAYGEFEYAREAVQLGVDYYLIKDEIDETYLKEKLKFLQGLMLGGGGGGGGGGQKAVVDFFQMGETYVREFYKEKALKNFLDGAYNYFLIEQNLPILLDEKWEIRIVQNDFPVLVEECLAFATQNDLNVKIHSILPENRLLLVLGRSGKSEYEERQTHYFAAKKLCDKLNSKEKGRYTLYVTDYRIPFGELYRLLKEGEGMIEAKYFCGTGKVYSLMKQPMEEGDLTDIPTKENLAVMLQEGELNGNLKKIYDACFLKKRSLRPLSSYFRNVYQILFQEEKKYSVLLFDNDTMCGKLFDYQVILEWLLDYEERISKWKEEKDTKNIRPEVKRAVQYIKENYTNSSLKVSMIAEYLNISESRLSVIFKEDTGKTLIQYLTAVRIEKTKKLLDTTDYKVYEIAELVGYNNSQYLSNVFARETGCFPLEYKNRK